MSEPFIISSKITNPKLGAHEQPHLFKMPCGDIHLVFHSDGDIHGATRVVLRSRDKGKTWEPMPISVNRHEAVGVLRDGTVLVYDDYAFRKEGNVFVGQMCVSKDGGRTFGPVELASFHRPDAAGSVAAGTYWKAKGPGQVPHNFGQVVGPAMSCLVAKRPAKERWNADRLRAHQLSRRQERQSPRCLLPLHRRRPNLGLGIDRGLRSGRRWRRLCRTGDVALFQRRRALHDASWIVAGSVHGRWKTWQPYKNARSPRCRSRSLPDDRTGSWRAATAGPATESCSASTAPAGSGPTGIQIYEYQRGSFGYTGIVEVEPGKLLYVYDRRDSEHDGKATAAVQGVYITVKRKG